MGTLTDAGLIVDGKVPDKYFKSYVNDVVEMLQSGKGMFPDNIPCGKEVKPSKVSQGLDLNDKEMFPDFHKIWRPRFENMVLSLDLEGDFQLAKAGLVGAVDPTALAVKLGLEPPKLDMIGALAQMLPPLDKLFATEPYLIANFNGLVDTPDKIIKNIPAIPIKMLAAVLPSPPAIPKITIPNPVLLDFGYTEQFNFDLKLGLAPFLIQTGMILPPDVGGLLKVFLKLATGDPGGLIEFVCNHVSKNQPESMSTSDTEIAAQKVLQQYQVKYQSITFVGQLIGNGTVTKALSTMSVIGFTMIEEVKEEGPIVFKTQGSLAQIRTTLGETISTALGPVAYGTGAEIDSITPGGKETKFAATAITIKDVNEQSEKVVENLEAAANAAKAGEAPADNKTYAKVADFEKKEAPAGSDEKQTEAFLNTAVVGAELANGLDKLFDKDGNRKSGVILAGRFDGLSAADVNNLRRIAGGFTTCGVFIGKIINMTMIKMGVPNPQRRKYTGTAWQSSNTGEWSKDTYSVTLASGALIGYCWIGLNIEKSKPALAHKVWNCLDITTKATPEDIATKTPKRGDILLDFVYAAAEARAETTASLIAKITKNGVAPTKDQLNSLKGSAVYIAAQKREEALNAGIAPELKPVEKVSCVHVSFFWEKFIKAGEEYWITADGGQGDAFSPMALWRIKKIIRDNARGILVIPGETDDAGVFKAKVDTINKKPGNSNLFYDSNTKEYKQRFIGGWLDIDRLPELTEELNNKTHEFMAKQAADAAAADKK